MIVGPKRVLFMDEISTGLDSSTTFAIIKYLRDITHMMQYTTAIALLQPAPETYDLFDDIMLIAEGARSFHRRTQSLACIRLTMSLSMNARPVHAMSVV